MRSRRSSRRTGREPRASTCSRSGRSSRARTWRGSRRPSRASCAWSAPAAGAGRLRGARVILVDADVLGRRRTGEETYVLNLLRQLPFVAPDLTFAAVTRRPDLVPEGVEAIELPARFQETRMAWSLPRLLR